jgi:hypothetical protein
MGTIQSISDTASFRVTGGGAQGEGGPGVRPHPPHSNSATAVVKAPCPRIGAILGEQRSPDVCLTHPLPGERRARGAVRDVILMSTVCVCISDSISDLDRDQRIIENEYCSITII